MIKITINELLHAEGSWLPAPFKIKLWSPAPWIIFSMLPKLIFDAPPIYFVLSPCSLMIFLVAPYSISSAPCSPQLFLCSLRALNYFPPRNRPRISPQWWKSQLMSFCMRGSLISSAPCSQRFFICSLNYFLCSMLPRLFPTLLPGCFAPQSPGSPCRGPLMVQ